MSLVKLTVTPRKRRANRLNSRKSTGPRTRAGKSRSRLNALRKGKYSSLLLRYRRLWAQILAHGPYRPPDWWRFKDMPLPADREFDSGPEIQEFLWRVRAYLPLRERGVFGLRHFDAEIQPSLNWGEIGPRFL
jgi:hypothetical protein